LTALRATLALLLPALALLLLGAHFFRAGLVPVAAACVALLAVLFVRGAWAARVLQAVLALGALEWLRTLAVFASTRLAMGQPYGRLLVTLGAVALLTLLAAWLAGKAPARRSDRPPG
jgi:hypothetical protein